MSERLEKRLVLLLCLVTDALILWVAMNVATLTRLPTLIYLDSMAELHRDQALCLALYLAAFVVSGAYHPARIIDRFDSVYFAAVGLGVVAVGLVGAATVLPKDTLAISRRELLLGPVLAGLALVLWRYYLGGLASRFPAFHRFFYVLGQEEQAKRIAEGIRQEGNARADASAISLQELRDKVQSARDKGDDFPFRHQDAIIVTAGPERETSTELLEFCETHFRRTYVYPSLHDMLFFRQSKLLAFAGVPLIEVSNRQFFSPYGSMKRSVDILTASAGLLMASPICIATALAVKFSSPGPIFYSQERMGLNGKHFNLYKFRSMVTDAEQQTGPVWARVNDDRVTPVGRFIRKHRVDEIPQLLNVLKGDMSLIGPRPERPHFHEEFCAKWPLFARRLAIRPGVTSLSHVLGSYDSDPEDRLRYDLMYISSFSPVVDMKILVATVRVVLGAKGAQ